MIIESVKNFCKDKLKLRVIYDYKNEIVDRNLFRKFANGHASDQLLMVIIV